MSIKSVEKDIVYGAQFRYGRFRVGSALVRKRRAKTLVLEKSSEGFGYRTVVPIEECFETQAAAVASIVPEMEAALVREVAVLEGLKVELQRARSESVETEDAGKQEEK